MLAGPHQALSSTVVRTGFVGSGEGAMAYQKQILVTTEDAAHWNQAIFHRRLEILLDP
jgi:hypothetical protein